MNERRRQRADCAELACLNVPARQHLRAAVNEPREICGVVRHANEKVVSTSSGGCMRRWRHVCGKVHVLCADNVGMPQLAHEQYLPNRQPRHRRGNADPHVAADKHSRKSVRWGGCTSRKHRCNARSVSGVSFLTASIRPRASEQHSTTPAVPLPTNLTGRSSSGTMNACCVSGVTQRPSPLTSDV